MLDEQSYQTAIYVYTGAAGIMLLYLAWWLGRSWSAGWATLAVLLAAGLLLTPAFPEPDAATMAPALVVLGFQLLTGGAEAAVHTAKLLAGACGAAVLLAALMRLTLFRRRAHRHVAPDAADTVAPAGEEVVQ